jgi:3-oxoadipate enol-lactonase
VALTLPLFWAGPSGPPPLPTGREIELPGRGTTFFRELAGPPGAPTVLLLHGLAATADLNWYLTFGPLGEHFRVVALDHRGHGRGIRSRERFRLASCADDAVALADELGIDTFIPVGYSMGGPIAQLAWYRHSERVDGMVLCATSRDFRGHPRERVLFGALAAVAVAARLDPTHSMRTTAELALSLRLAGQPYARWALRELRRTDSRAVLEAAGALGRFTSRDWISEIDVPIAVVVTKLDRLVPAHRQVKLAQAIPSATIHVVEGDHYVPGRQPDAFVGALVEACQLVARRVSTKRTRQAASSEDAVAG